MTGTFTHITLCNDSNNYEKNDSTYILSFSYDRSWIECFIYLWIVT